MDIKLKGGQDGLYLGKFDDKEEAEEYVHDLINWYKTRPKDTRPTLAQVIRDEEANGVKIHYTQLHRWITNSQIKIPKNIGNRKSDKKQRLTFYVPKWLNKAINNYPFTKKQMGIWGYKLVMGYPITDMLVVFFGQHKNAIFRDKSSQIQVAITNDFDENTIKMIRGLVNSAEGNGGLQFIKQYAKNAGLLYFGGDETDDVSPTLVHRRI